MRLLMRRIGLLLLIQLFIQLLIQNHVYAPPSPPLTIAAHYSGKLFTYSEYLDITSTILYDKLQLGNVEFYTRVFEVNRPLDALQIELAIPFVGNQQANARSRIFLVVNDKILADATKHDAKAYELHQIVLRGMITEVQPGTLTVQVRAAVDKGALAIPHYDANGIEATMDRALFAKMHLLGFPSKKKKKPVKSAPI